MNMYDYTSIGRPLEPLTYANHRRLMLMAVILGGAAGLWALFTGQGWGLAFRAGFVCGAGVVTAWVLARELDIDHELSGLAVALFAGVILVFAPAGVDVLALTCFIIGGRVVNRIVGPPARIADSALLLVTAALAIALGTPWTIGAVVMLAFVLDALLVQPQRLQLVAAVVALGVTAGGFWLQQNTPRESIPLWVLGLLGVVLVVYGVFWWQTRDFRTEPDLARYTLETVRVRAAMLLPLIGGVLLLAVGGAEVSYQMLPLWVCMGGVAAYNGIMRQR